MGERLVPLSRTKLIRRFKDLGWNGPHRGRRHDTMHKAGQRPLTIPNNHSGDVKRTNWRTAEAGRSVPSRVVHLLMATVEARAVARVSRIELRGTLSCVVRRTGCRRP